jgi:hypothetical protein
MESVVSPYPLAVRTLLTWGDRTVPDLFKLRDEIKAQEAVSKEEKEQKEQRVQQRVRVFQEYQEAVARGDTKKAEELGKRIEAFTLGSSKP